MPAKKIKKVPPSTTAGTTSSSPRAGVTTSSSSLSSLSTSKVSGAAKGTEAKGRLCSPVSTYLSPCETRIHKPLMLALGANYGDLVELSTHSTSAAPTPTSSSTTKGQSPRLVLRVLPPTDACRTMNQSTDIAVSMDTMYAMGSSDRVYIRCLTVPVSVLANLTISVSTAAPAPSPSSSNSNTQLSESSMILLEAAVRKQFRMCVVYTGMKAIVRIGTHPIEVSLESVTPIGMGVHNGAGYLSDGTSIQVTDQTSTHRTAAIDEKATTDIKEDITSSDSTTIPTHHTLYHGPSGTGKTHMLEEIANRVSTLSPAWNIYRFSALEGVGSINAFVTTIDRLWASLQRRVGSSTSGGGGVLVVLDNIDILVSPNSTEGPAASLRFCAALSELMGRFLPVTSVETGAVIAPPQVLFVASASSLGSFPTQLLCPNQFGRRCVSMLPPASAADRRKVLATLFQQSILYSTNNTNNSDESNTTSDMWSSALDVASRDSHGFNQRDLSKVRSTAAAVAFDARGSTSLQPTDLLQAARAVRPSALSTVEVAIPNVKWSDIGGSDEAKSVLKEYVEWCLGEQRWVFESLRLPPPKGVLLYGPPGCSKTMLAKALANESKMNFVSVKGPEVFSKWVGDSEKAVRRVFAQARAAAPCVVFIDELDGMCGHRGSGGVGDRVISQLLTELDGLPAAISSKSDNIILVAATNRPENIDGAVLRPGRIDRRVYVGLPTIGERRAIAELSLKRIPCLVSEVNPDLVASRTDGYTGAEVVAVCKETSFQALTRSMAAESVLGVDFEAALLKVRPRVSAEDVNWYLQWGKQSSV